MMRKFRFPVWLVLGMALLVSSAGIAAAAGPTTADRLKAMGGILCPDSAFTCVTIQVPLDHFNSSDTRKIDVKFAVLPASGTRKGIFVTATGGPGTAGISYADSYTSYFLPELPQAFDIVFFDQRGVGLSGGLDCYKATAKFYQSDFRADSARREDKLRTAAKTYADECDAEMGHPDILPYLSTEQAVEDLEQFRAMMGDDKFWLYGESYGTQYAQTYAHAHPDHLGGMILDGTVDLTPDGVSYYALAAQGFSDALVGSLEQCKASENCAADFGGNPLGAYDKLAAQLKAGYLKYAFPMPDGTKVNRRYKYADLSATAEDQMYGEGGRMMFVRALAAYKRDGDIVPLARLLYLNLGVDEATLEPSYDPSWSDAYYYGVECQDYGYYTGTGEKRADQYVAQAKPVELSGLRLTGLMWGDLPCVYWRDSSQNTTRPPHWNAPGVPTLVLNALADPITPMTSARPVYENLDDAYLVTQRGGPHVIFGRGRMCIDTLVTDFLVHDMRPAQRETECPGRTMSRYIPLAPADASAFPSLVEAFDSVETEINYLPEYWYWDYVTKTKVGCTKNGTMEFKAVENRAAFQFDNCAFSTGFNLTGKGKYQFGKDRFVLDVHVTGLQDCQLRYVRAGNSSTVTGSCDSNPVRLRGAVDSSAFVKENPRERIQTMRARR